MHITADADPPSSVGESMEPQYVQPTELDNQVQPFQQGRVWVTMVRQQRRSPCTGFVECVSFRRIRQGENLRSVANSMGTAGIHRQTVDCGQAIVLFATGQSAVINTNKFYNNYLSRSLCDAEHLTHG